MILAVLLPSRSHLDKLTGAPPGADCHVAERRTSCEGVEPFLIQQRIIFIPLEILFATVVDIVVDDCRVELHADDLQQEAQHIPETRVTRKEMFAAKPIYRVVISQQIP